MAKLTFRIPAELAVTDDDCRVIHVVGSDRVVRSSVVSRTADRLLVDLQEVEGVKVKVPFRTASRTPVLLTTCSLRPDNCQPYNLVAELARGTLFRFRTLAVACREADVDLPQFTQELLQQATDKFAQAVVAHRHRAEADLLADEALVLALHGLEQLEPIYAKASQQAVHQHQGDRAFLRGIALPATWHPDVSPLLTQGINSVMVEPNWKLCETDVGQYEWEAVDQSIDEIKRRGLATVLGPMLSLDELTTPDWLYLWENDFEELLGAAVRYCQALVERFQGEVDLWYCAAGLNDRVALDLKEEQRLRLLVNVVQTLRGSGLRAPLLVSFAKPWGEYLKGSDRQLAPIHFAEELVRARVGITGIGLEMNFGESEPASYFRGFFDIVELLDQWSLLGMPLFVTLSAPSSWRADPGAIYDPRRTTEPLERISRRTQRLVVEHLLPALYTHPQVQGVFWSQATDTVPHRFPNAGLIDQRGRAKSALRRLEDLTHSHFPKN